MARTHPIVVLFYVLFVLYRSMYCLCINVYYCHRVTTQLQLTNISYIISNVLSPSTEMNGMYSLHHTASYLTKNVISVFTAIIISNLTFKIHNKVQAKTTPVPFSSGSNSFYTVTLADA